MRIATMAVATGLAITLTATSSEAAPDKKAPYFASIRSARARMRTGPGKSYPASWVYQRADLPVRVLDSYEHDTWVKVEDPSGTQGWMLASLIGKTRTGFVKGSPVELRERPEPDAKMIWRAAPGVVGRLSRCADGWCYLDVHGRGGFVEAQRLWGVEAQETFN